ncbi:hypothetical protein ACLESO_10275 [Pyxidicoccus sp. 3LG]
MPDTGLSDEAMDQLKLISEYIKFHIGLYLATPPVFVILAEGLEVNTSRPWLVGIGFMLVIYLVSGLSAGWFMGKFINHRWDKALLDEVSQFAYSKCRRFLHHWLYWLGLLAGIVGLLLALKESGLPKA